MSLFLSNTTCNIKGSRWHFQDSALTYYRRSILLLLPQPCRWPEQLTGLNTPANTKCFAVSSHHMHRAWWVLPVCMWLRTKASGNEFNQLIYQLWKIKSSIKKHRCNSEMPLFYMFTCEWLQLKDNNTITSTCMTFKGVFHHVRKLNIFPISGKEYIVQHANKEIALMWFSDEKGNQSNLQWH